MKRCIGLILAAALLLPLCACGFPDSEARDTVTFYYPRKEILYGVSDSVIAGEAREVQGYTNNLQYLLLLYLRGPASAELRSPFPAGIRLVGASQDGETLNIVLAPSLDNLSSLEKNLACACLTITCLELTDATTVSITTESGIQAGEKPIVMDSACLLLVDDSATAPTVETAQ